MIFYKKKISKETFADELGTNLAEGKTWNLRGKIRGQGRTRVSVSTDLCL